MSSFSKVPEVVETRRLLLRPPEPADAEAIFQRYSSDAEVTLYLSWPRHRGVDEARTFVEFSEAAWQRWPAGPYLIFTPDGVLRGGTGFNFEARDRAEVGYVLAKDSWGRGYATEALRAMVEVAAKIDVRCLHALCHTEHEASWRVLEKCSFKRAEDLIRNAKLPNLGDEVPVEMFYYSKNFGKRRETES